MRDELEIDYLLQVIIRKRPSVVVLSEEDFNSLNGQLLLSNYAAARQSERPIVRSLSPKLLCVVDTPVLKGIVRTSYAVYENEHGPIIELIF